MRLSITPRCMLLDSSSVDRRTDPLWGHLTVVKALESNFTVTEFRGDQRRATGGCEPNARGRQRYPVDRHDKNAQRRARATGQAYGCLTMSHVDELGYDA